MKGMILYRILSAIVNTVCVLLAFNIVASIIIVLSNPLFLFIICIMLCVVLYAWHANKFFRTVIVKNHQATKRQKDWIQVNAIVSIIFSVLIFVTGLALLANPRPYLDSLKTIYKDAIPVKAAMIQLYFMTAFCFVLLIHIIWTYILIRRYKDYFVEEERS